MFSLLDLSSVLIIPEVSIDLYNKIQTRDTIFSFRKSMHIKREFCSCFNLCLRGLEAPSHSFLCLEARNIRVGNTELPCSWMTLYILTGFANLQNPGTLPLGDRTRNWKLLSVGRGIVSLRSLMPLCNGSEP